jgi:hypothetical protein
MPHQSLTAEALPFPHLAADGWWDVELLRRVAAEFPGPAVPGWRRYENSTERKLEGPPGLWGPATRELFRQIEARTADLERAFGIGGLQMETVGGGYHLIPPGGYLAVHADFNRSPLTGRYRRLNHLIYLNDGWDDEGGALELWDAGGPVVSVAPELNRTVVFETSDHSWHGHPRPAARWRKSVAAYFFTDQPPDGYTAEHSTLWHAEAASHA